MTAQQLTPNAVLASMVFSLALELKLSDFARVAPSPRAVVCGLIAQFVLLPVSTWLATLALDLSISGKRILQSGRLARRLRRRPALAA